LDESSKKKVTTLWTVYSALKKQLLVRENVDVSPWKKPMTFLKMKGDEETKKKAKVFTREDINFLFKDKCSSISDRDKLGFLLGVFGALRAEELAFLTFGDIEVLDATSLKVSIRKSKTDKAGNGFTFFATSTPAINIIELFNSYKAKVTNPMTETRLF
jgi:hypothetical protein